ncbi:hypothetical protein CR513_58562, partial [Mucuna pruriens]
MHPSNESKTMFTTDEVLREHQLKLNSDKCFFGVKAKKFLGFLLTKQRIEANPKKSEAMIRMRSLKNVKEVQQLAGRITPLARFLSQMSNNKAEYEALLVKMRLARELGAKVLVTKSNSQLVTKQVNYDYQAS